MDETKFKEAMASMIKDPAQRDALAAMIVEYVDPSHITTDFVSLLMPTRALNVGDILVKKLRKGLHVHSLVPGSIHLKEEITVTERANYVLDGAIIGAQANYWELQSGEIGTVESIRSEMQFKLRDYFINKVFTALSTVWSAANTPDNYINVGAALTYDVLDDAIKQINLTTPGAKAIVGTRAALQPITKFGAFWDNGAASPTTFPVPSAIEEVMRTGWLGQYSGVPIIVVPQNWDNPEDYNKLVPEDQILVIGEDIGEFITYGTPQAKQWDDMRPTPPYWNLEIYQQFGMIVSNAKGIYLIDNLK
jgi:hypothetical protein